MDSNTTKLASVSKDGQRVQGAAGLDRRQFLKWMGWVGAAAVVGAGAGLRGIGSAMTTAAPAEQASPQTAVAEATQTTSTASSSTPSSAVTQSTTPSTCTVRCRNACSYPGHCKRYTDSNGNGRCDYGECM